MSRAQVEPVLALRAIKAIHSLVWAFFAGAILAIPFAAWLGEFTWAAGLAAVVLIECAILAFNRMRCPLTAVAARYTEDRRANFDIYLHRRSPVRSGSLDLPVAHRRAGIAGIQEGSRRLSLPTYHGWRASDQGGSHFRRVRGATRKRCRGTRTPWRSGSPDAV